MAGFAAGFRSLTEERSNVTLPVDGEVPAWLDGALIRNGPAKFDVDGERVAHWFDGLAMLHRFGFEDGTVRYTNRFLRSDAYEAAQRGERPGSEFATPGGEGGLLSRAKELVRAQPTDNANVHVARLGEEYVALTETPRGITFDPRSLETTGHAECSGTTVHHVVAHLARDDERGETWGIGVQFGLRTSYQVFRISDGTTRRESVATVRRSRPAYIHDLALTDEYAVVLEPPFVVDPKRFLLEEGAFIDHYEWKPERGTTVLVVNRESGRVREYETDARFVFHLANAFVDRGGDADTELVVDAVTYDDASIVSDLYLDAVESNPQPSDGTLQRFRVPLRESGDPEVGVETRYEGTELPRVSPDVAGRSYSYVYGQATGREGMNGLVKVDVETGVKQEWWEEGLWLEEPVFVPEPGAEREDAGVVLATALEEPRERTVLLVLNGTTFTERARAPLPHAAPFGFHGRFFPEA